MIKRGAADVMIAGGSEAAVCKLGIAVFVLKVHYFLQHTPKEASRPGIKIEMVLLWVKVQV